MYLNKSVLTCTLFFNKAYKCIKKNALKNAQKKFTDLSLDLSNNVKYKILKVKTLSDAKLHYSTQ